MYITYANFVLNANEKKMPRKASINLKNVFDRFAGDVTKMKSANGRFRINNLEVCSSNRGCAVKKAKRESQDYLTAYIDDNKGVHRMRTSTNEAKYVVMFLNGTYLIGGVKCNVNVRLPPSGVVKVSIGLSTQTEIVPDSNGDTKLEALKNDLQRDVSNAITELELVRPTRLVGMNVEGHKLKVGGRISNLVSTMKKLASQLPEYRYDFQEREGKSVPRQHLKPKNIGEHPTIGVTTFGMVGLSGATSIKQVLDTVQRLNGVFESIKNTITINATGAVQPKSVKKVSNSQTKSCPKGNPQPNAAGSCPLPSMIPRPNLKTKGLCCYRQKLTKSVAKQLVNSYKEADMKMPKELANRIETMINTKYASVKYASVKASPRNTPTYNKKKDRWMYKSKTYNCQLLNKVAVQEIAQSLGLNPKFKKYELCEIIQKKLDEQRRLQGLKALRKFKVLKAKAMNAKFSN